ncbi:MAG TPA: CpsB/CapC family capsule biosynthesis tyrosine phosphatase [Polyangiaceae bacterium]|jgi:protein-tyrosine phosphatase|nr:CpsB/CapC family capsule biosynthesis tyrosine phosphatase [Polyangiaceae bacterium]
MSGFVDLHCHFVPGIDDGARTRDEGVELLRALRECGFERVIATPHMRPRMFDNTKDLLVSAFARFEESVKGETAIPKIALSSEHYFDDIVFQRLLDGDGLPYPGGNAVLLEFYDNDFMPAVAERLFDLRRRKLVPVIAHPERYRCFWRSHERLAELVKSGATALLDVAALVGKYGKEPQKCARRLLDDGIYHAACSDAHRPEDVDDVEDGMELLGKRYGEDEVRRLFHDGPREILEGRT